MGTAALILGKDNVRMIDSSGRKLDYLRISVTDRCNLNCVYCMPEKERENRAGDYMTDQEIFLAAEAMAELGVRHIRITGGEPLVRRDCWKLVGGLKALPGIETVTMTTNGVLLAKHLKKLKESGIDGLNISLDTRDRACYQKITGQDETETVEQAIRLACAMNIPVKINAVSYDFAQDRMGGNRKETEPWWLSAASLAQELPVDVRFIEMMPLGYGKKFPTVSHQQLLKELEQFFPGMKPDRRCHGQGPAVYYQVPGFKGSLGLISAIHEKFCSRCNRMRLTAQGFLKPCLAYPDGVDLRPLLKREKKEELKEAVRKAASIKPSAHCFENPQEMREQRNMIEIGG